MKRKISIALLLVAMLVFVACAGFVKTNYRILYASKTAYYTAMQSVADLQEKEIITADQRNEINKVAKIYKEAHNVYEDSMEVYIRTNDAASKDRVRVALTEAASKWKDLAKLINAIKPGTVPEALSVK